MTVTAVTSVTSSLTGQVFLPDCSSSPALPTTHPATSLLSSLTHTLETLLHSALASSSQAGYQRSWQLFHAFLSQLNLPMCLPISVSVLALFIAYLVQLNYAPSTISTHVSAIGYVHKLQSLDDPTSSFLIQKLLHANQKRPRSVDSRLPIDKVMLDKLGMALSHTIQATSQRTLYKAMFFLAFHAFLRIGEITVSAPGHRNPNLIHFSQIKISSYGLELTFLAFKHSNGRPFVLKVSRCPPSLSCPVAILSKYLAIRGTSPGPLFIDAAHNPVTRAAFNEQLRTALCFCGFNSKFFKAHSFRIGAASAAAAQGLSDSQIRLLGRWKSDAFKKYIRNAGNTSSL